MIESWLLGNGPLIGYVIFGSIIFAESGILIGAFFPGDSLLVSAGVAASQGFFSITTLWIIAALGAILGDSVGYWFGNKIGRNLYTDNRKFLNKKHLAKTEHYYERWGTLTVIVARFIPMARTLAPILAGVGKMKYTTFLTYNIVGGLLWVTSMLGVGFWFGHIVGENIDVYILPLVLGIILLSFLPVLLGWMKMLKSS
jgi:membrane-associated protein